MATTVTIAGQTYKKRNIFAVWLLPFITLGIYYYVYWYKINDEARRFLGDESIRPGVAVLALIVIVLGSKELSPVLPHRRWCVSVRV